MSGPVVHVQLTRTPQPASPSWEECLAALTAVLGAPSQVRDFDGTQSGVIRDALWWRGDPSTGCVGLVAGPDGCSVSASTGQATRTWCCTNLDGIESFAAQFGIRVASPDVVAREALAFMGWEHNSP